MGGHGFFHQGSAWAGVLSEAPLSRQVTYPHCLHEYPAFSIGRQLTIQYLPFRADPTKQRRAQRDSRVDATTGRLVAVMDGEGGDDGDDGDDGTGSGHSRDLGRRCFVLGSEVVSVWEQ